jgi:inositol-pentakisphosphate 2-kinase
LSTADDSDIPAALADRLLPALKRSAVLQRLASLQSSLDHLDIEGLLATSGADESMRVNLEDYVRFAQSYPINLNPHTLDCSAKDRLVAFLLAATLKDCSIIARLALSTPVALTDGASPSSRVSCDQVKVIDLDPKPADRLPKWAKLDRDIVSHFAEHLERVGSEHVRKCCDG